MAKAAVFLSFFIVAVLYNLKFASAKTQKMVAEGFDVGRPKETACFEFDIGFQKDTSGMYVGVPSKLFTDKDGKNTCGKKLKVSCIGGKAVCKNHKAVELTIIDTNDDDFIEISNKAFNTISDFNVGIINVMVTTEF